MLFAMSMTVAISGNRQKLSLAKLHCKMLVLKKLDAFEVRGCDLLLLFGTWPPIGKNGSQCCEARKLLVHVVGIWPISYAKKLVQCKGREGLVGTDLGAMDCGNPDVCST
ncbi:unnamed protein product [Durusdinium trenchii]|uniref:Uncharacterized protein n=1 Tax=Durusdinium trenchii TaxID=1381693 RepID=A0ABP0RCH8_9DINO